MRCTLAILLAATGPALASPVAVGVPSEPKPPTTPIEEPPPQPPEQPPVEPPEQPPPEQPPPEEPPPQPPEQPPQPPPLHEPTAAEVARAPVPGDESGRLDSDGGDSLARVVGRAALVVPKLAFELGTAPLHGVVWAYDRYQLNALYYRWFFNADHTIGMTPTATYESGFGASIGARLLDNDLFGDKELAAFQATTGALTGEVYRESFLGELRSGNRFGKHFGLALVGNFTRRPADPFYGIGNGREVPAPNMPIDPLASDAAVPTYYRYQEANVQLTADVRPIKEIHLIATGSLTKLAYAQSTTGEPIGEVYQTDKLGGFMDGVEHAYVGGELRLDTRRRYTPWEPINSTGSLVAVYAGRVLRLDGGSEYTRYGAELQHLWHISHGPRMLITRVRGEAVTGNLADIPFTELPYLGGGQFLRGYSFERFRDRVAIFGSVQYQWDLSHLADAYIFTDAGRVYSDLDDVGLHAMRVGYGVGLEIHGDSHFLLDTSIASSIDGGIFFSVSFNPVLDARPRWR